MVEEHKLVNMEGDAAVVDYEVREAGGRKQACLCLRIDCSCGGSCVQCCNGGRSLTRAVLALFWHRAAEVVVSVQRLRNGRSGSTGGAKE